jgi:3'-phosphoadenosine 5'-phosphosulfate sulfotransferase (PAPS reductase)/FAD synthetase
MGISLLFFLREPASRARFWDIFPFVGGQNKWSLLLNRNRITATVNEFLGKLATQSVVDYFVDYRDYDLILVAFSGGKDSTACFLQLLESGVSTAKIELWHNDVDGRSSHLMDWPSTPEYCRAFAEAFGVPIYFSWRLGGFEREMLRNNTPTAPIQWENPDKTIGTTGGKGPKNTRLKFPQVSADLSTRWCSGYLKIDVASSAIRNQPRFDGKKTLVISGERAEESPCRARYKPFEPDRTTSKTRTVDRFRPVHAWKEQQVWDIIRKYKVRPAPAYRLGWNRLSCRACIFGQKNQWASLRAVDPKGFQTIADYETRFGYTIHRQYSVIELANNGTPYSTCSDQTLVAEALNPKWNGRIILDESEWELPAGAFGAGGGPS